MVELRKRKAAEPAPAPPAKKASSGKSTASKAKGGKKDTPANGASSSNTNSPGGSITLEGFGGKVETHDGEKTTLKKLVDDSKAGVVLFTYPKASTPGCTTQACLFRDDYKSLTATGFSIYGLSTDAPKANTTFKTKQNLPYTLLCDPSASLIAAIGLKKAPKGTTRGVFVVDKDGKILASEAGGPAATVDVVKKLVGAAATTSEDVGNAAEGSKVEKEIEEGKADAQEAELPAPSNGEAEQKEDEQKADVAADVADTAEKIDEGVSA